MRISAGLLADVVVTAVTGAASIGRPAQGGEGQIEKAASKEPEARSEAHGHEEQHKADDSHGQHKEEGTIVAVGRRQDRNAALGTWAKQKGPEEF